MSKPESGHWYLPDGTPMHFVPRAKGDGTRPATLADAKKLLLVPSVTTVLRCLDKPALRDWLIRQAVHAVVTAPDIPGEALDAKLERILVTERQQDQESRNAMDLGTQIHAALELGVQGQEYPPDMAQYIEPALQQVRSMGEVVACEQVLVGDGYAGKADLILQTPQGIEICDFKTTKKPPKADKGSWVEHRLQNSAYAAAYRNASVVATSNLYVSTDPTSPGLFVYCRQTDWMATFENGFEPLLKVWCFMSDYQPPRKP